MGMIKNDATTGIVVGGGATALGMTVLPMAAVKWPTVPGAQFVRENWWAGGVLGAAAGWAGLHFTGRKEAAKKALLASAVVLAPSVLNSLAARVLAPSLPAAPAGSSTNGLGIAVAEPRSGFGAPNIELFSAAPDSIQLLNAANAPETAGPQNVNAAVFGGGSF